MAEFPSEQHEETKKMEYLYKSELHLAAKNNDPQEIECLLSSGADVNARDDNGQTALHIAAGCNDDRYDGRSFFDTIEVLLKNGADINAQDKNGKTPLHCLGFSNVKMLKLLLKYNAEVKIKDNNGETPLTHALCKNFESKVIELLVERGSDLNSANYCGLTPLHYASISCDFVKIQHLIKLGADVNAKNFKIPPFYKHIFEFPRFCDNFNKYLLNHADVNIIDVNGDNILSTINPCNNSWILVFKHFAKLQALGVLIHPEILETISHNEKYDKFFKECTKELQSAKITKLSDSWVTFFNLLTDNKIKLKNYAGNAALIKNFENSDCLNMFPVYGSTIVTIMKKAIERRRCFDQSTLALSDCLPVFNPTHLIIRDILDCLTFKNYLTLVSNNFFLN